MKKIKLFLIIFLFIMCMPFVVNAETLTITFDANDGSGRTKVVEYEKGPSYKMLGADSFNYLNDDPDDPMDDKVIKGWSKTPDGTATYEANYDITRSKNAGPTVITSYDVLNNADEITLYGIWTERKDVTYMINSFTVTGEGVTQKENGDYNIPLNSSVEFEFILKEKAPSGGLPYQLTELSYIDLPDSFFEYFPNYALETFSVPKSVPIRITYSGNVYATTHTKKYVKGHKLFLDIIPDGSYGAHLVNSSTDITLKFTFYGKVKMVENNGHWVRGITLSYEIPDNTTEEDYSFPQGQIVIKYVDIDTGEELAAEEIGKGVIWTKYTSVEKKINNYELIEQPLGELYYLDNENQTFYYKYRKVAGSPSTENNTLVEVDNPNTNTVNNTPEEVENANIVNNTLEEVDNPKTGESTTILVLMIVIIAASFYIYMTMRKNAKNFNINS